MRYEFKLPDLAEGMVEGEVVNWLVNQGDSVKEEQPVVEVMTDKATVVISSPKEGTVSELAWEAGDIVEVGSVLFVLDVDGEAAPEAEAAPEEEPAKAPEPAPTPPAQSHAAPPSPAATRGVAPVPRGGGKALATPATRRLARELNVDIGQVTGTGPAGRITKADVRAFAEGRTAAPAPAAVAHSPVAAAAAPQAAPAAAKKAPAPAYAYIPPTPQPLGAEPEERVRLRGLRRAIYETMARSTSTAAHFTYVEEIDCENLYEARKRLKPSADAVGVRLTYLPFIAKAALLALRYFPKMNAVMDDEASEIVLKRYYHLGIAAATPGGLMVPVVKHADKLTLMELSRAVNGLGDRARDNTLKPDELRGSTFTITSLGKTGGLMATPIINHPEVAILGVHKMEQRAVVRGGEIVARRMMNLSLSFDHRVIDGHEGADFCQRIKFYLEDPERMMLEMG